MDVFKLCDVDNLKEFEVLGDVTPHMVRQGSVCIICNKFGRVSALFTEPRTRRPWTGAAMQRCMHDCSVGTALAGFSSAASLGLMLALHAQDRIIGKKVFKVRGIIPAANYVRVPKLKSQNLGLTGRFLYMQAGLGCKCSMQSCMLSWDGSLVWADTHAPIHGCFVWGQAQAPTVSTR